MNDKDGKHQYLDHIWCNFHTGPVYRPPPKPIKQNMIHVQSSQSSNIHNNNSGY